MRFVNLPRQAWSCFWFYFESQDRKSRVVASCTTWQMAGERRSFRVSLSLGPLVQAGSHCVSLIFHSFKTTTEQNFAPLVTFGDLAKPEISPFSSFPFKTLLTACFLKWTSDRCVRCDGRGGELTVRTDGEDFLASSGCWHLTSSQQFHTVLRVNVKANSDCENRAETGFTTVFLLLFSANKRRRMLPLHHLRGEKKRGDC